MPLGVSAIRGVGLPDRGASMTDLVTIAPILDTSTNCASSRPAPAQPDAVMIGLGSSTCPSLVRRSTPMALPPAATLAGLTTYRLAGGRLAAGRLAAGRLTTGRLTTGRLSARRATAAEAGARPVPFLAGRALEVRGPARPGLPARRPERVERDGADVVPAHRLAPEDRAVDAGTHHPGDAVRADYR